MSFPIVYNGVTYLIPETGDEGWGPEVTSYLNALSSGSLTHSGGLFTLTADANFGAAFGLKAAYFSSRTANSAESGLLRLANNEAGPTWRNSIDTADLALTVGPDNILYFNGIPTGTSSLGTVTSVTVNGTAGRITSSGSPIIMSGAITVDLATTGVTPGIYTDQTIEVDAYGRIVEVTEGQPLADYESRLSTGQTVFNTTQLTLANDSKTYNLVFLNGVKQIEGLTYNVTGANQVTFLSTVPSGYNFASISYKTDKLDGLEYDAFTATAAQTVFNTSTPTVNGAVLVYVNGVYQVENLSYTVTGTNQITFLSGLTLGWDVEIIELVPLQQELMVANAGQTEFNTIVTTETNITGLEIAQEVYLNGVLQIEGLAYDVTGTNQITFLSGLTAGWDVKILSFVKGLIVAPAYELIEATSGQTVFNTSVITKPNNSDQTFLMVFVDGIKGREGASKTYTVTGTNQVTFNSGVTLGADVEFVSFINT